MVDPAAIPFLMKAVDFLFGEGSKILEERRERRKAEISSQNEEKKASPKKANAEAITSKEVAAKQQLDEFLVKQNEARIQHLLSLLDIYTKNYNLAKEQYAKWGGALVPQVITHNLIEAEDKIASAVDELKGILGRVYGKEIVIIDEHEE